MHGLGVVMQPLDRFKRILRKQTKLVHPVCFRYIYVLEEALSNMYMYMYTYVCMCTCSVRTSTCMPVQVHACHVRTSTCMPVHARTYMHAHTCTYIRSNLKQRADRLYSVKGIPQESIDPSLMSKSKLQSRNKEFEAQQKELALIEAQIYKYAEIFSVSYLIKDWFIDILCTTLYVAVYEIRGGHWPFSMYMQIELLIKFAFFSNLY